jgi:hypothetical protein
MPAAKFDVPSSGSITQVNSLSRRSQPVSSAMIECVGWRRRIACTIACSDARSAAVTTLLRSDFCVAPVLRPRWPSSNCPAARAQAMASSIIAGRRVRWTFSAR